MCYFLANQHASVKYLSSWFSLTIVSCLVARVCACVCVYACACACVCVCVCVLAAKAQRESLRGLGNWTSN